MMRWVLAGIVVIGLAACDGGHGRQLTYREMDQIARRSTDEQVHRAAPDTCQMAMHTNLVGAVGAEIDRTELPAGARVICHDCAVTMDYRADRLNVDLGADGRVTGLHCG
ncbi:MAG: I78 family peptidase inhibitor [Alphaproteobacteria bacterium]|nr:I78 family peptidase inhibitor [Alphaproteobacteria bacterium]